MHLDPVVDTFANKQATLWSEDVGIEHLKAPTPTTEGETCHLWNPKPLLFTRSTFGGPNAVLQAQIEFGSEGDSQSTVAWGNTRPQLVCRDNSLIRSFAPPQDHHRALGIALLYGPRGGGSFERGTPVVSLLLARIHETESRVMRRVQLRALARGQRLPGSRLAPRNASAHGARRPQAGPQKSI